MDIHSVAKALGRLGGQSRAKRLSEADKIRIAALGGKARAKSLTAAKNLKENFKYVTAMDELRKIPKRVTRLKKFAGRLPGIYLHE